MNQINNNYLVFIIILVFIFGYLPAFQEHAFPGENQNTVIAVSKRIKPYMNIVEGITRVLEEKSNIPDVFFLSDTDHYSKAQIVSKFLNGQFDSFATVGPEATALVWELKMEHPKIFTAVLDPANLLKNEGFQCGISLRIPVEKQIQEISKTFINLKRIGLLFDPRNNEWFYEKTLILSKQYGITIIPLKIESKNMIRSVLTENWENIDCVWMIPDKTVISEKVIQYIIKLGIYNKKGVIGYNSFFIRSGAFFSFDFDYKVLGIQTGQKLQAYLETGECHEESPEFQTIINQKVVDRIGLRVRVLEK